MPDGAVCLSPWLDLTHSGPSIIYNQYRDAMLDIHTIREAAKLYYRNQNPKNALISPLYGDLQGLPPLFIQASSSEVLLSDAVALKAKAKAQNVTVQLQVWRDMPHAWTYFAAILPEAKQALRQINHFVHQLPILVRHVPVNQSENITVKEFPKSA